MRKGQIDYSIIGKRFGRLTVLSYRNQDKNRKSIWNCQCDCGKFVLVSKNNLVCGTTTSCGCYNKEAISLPHGDASKNRLLHRYKTNAKRRGISFDLSDKEFFEITSSNCFYCNKKPERFIREKNFNGGVFYNGVDRIDNEKGYTSNNVVPCCSDCNYAKRKMSFDSFRNWIRKVSLNVNKLDRFGGKHASRHIA